MEARSPGLGIIPPDEDTESRPPKRSRPDVARRREFNQEHEFTVVKTSLTAFCTTESGSANLSWREVLLDMNKATAEAYILANANVIRLCREHLQIPALDPAFFRRCLVAVSAGMRAPRQIDDPHFSVSLEQYKSWRPASYRAADSSYISEGCFASTALQMATNTANAITVNFHRRFHRYVMLKYGVNEHLAYEFVKEVTEEEYDGLLNRNRVLEYKSLLPQPFPQLKSMAHLLVPLTYRFLDHFDSNPSTDGQTPGPKQFSILPHKKGFKVSYQQFNSTGLRNLLQRANIPVPSQTEWGTAGGAAEMAWRRLFNVSAFETATRKFAGVIETDGKACSILLHRPIRPPQCDETTCTFQWREYGEMWGLDPGRKDLFVATNQDRHTISCSTREFYEDARYTASMRKVKLWQKKDPVVRDAIRSMPTNKTCRLDAMRDYIAYVLPRLDMLLGFFGARRFQNLRFKRHIFKQKKMHAICRELTAAAGRNTVIGFGGWSNHDPNGTIKKSPAGPVQQLKAQLKRYCRVVSIDEFRTSKIHSNPACRNVLSNQVSQRRCKDGVVRNLPVHSVLHCKTSGCGVTVNRDVNASENMLALLRAQLEGLPRPRVFRR